MGLLPENKPQIPVDTPKNFVLFGKPMTGKSYLAERFPSPVFFNTDGNAQANVAPSVQIRNTENLSAYDQIKELIHELATDNHGFKTVILDVIDDIIIMIEQSIVALAEKDRQKNHPTNAPIKFLSDIPFGKGWGMEKTAVQDIVVSLKQLPMNVIYVSREIDLMDEQGNVTQSVPSLPQKWQNIVNGNSDLVIRTRKMGDNYLRQVTEQRKHYVKSRIDNKRILQIMEYSNYNWAKEPENKETAK
ncbi:AAA family ATPase [Oenococcus alcoholitolerans]|uniref:AAA family ATPase n=1 Tax=Oenococcus alcoholitolerans TaxID=931074 RepID=UPI003F6EF96A